MKSKVRYIDLQEIVPLHRNPSLANILSGTVLEEGLLSESHMPPSVCLFINRFLAIQGFKVHKNYFFVLSHPKEAAPKALGLCAR